MSETQELFLADLVELATVQPRATIHQPTVNQYAELYQERALMPPIRVVVVNESDDGEEKFDQFVVVDGFHRVAAARQAKLETITAVVTDGTMEQAKWEALSANATHGRRPSIEDMDRMIELALESELGKNMTNELLGAHLGCSARTIIRAKHRLGAVRAYTKSFEGFSDDATIAAVRTIEDQFPEEARAIREGTLKKDPKQLQEFAALPKHHRIALGPLFLDKNLSIEAARDVANLKPMAEEIPVGAYLKYAKEHPDDSTWTFDGVKARMDIVWVQD